MKDSLRFHIFCFSLILIVLQAESKIIRKELYINKGVFVTVKQTTFPFLSFNASPVFNPNSEVITTNTVDSLRLIIYNNDSVKHGFAIKNSKFSGLTILAGQKDSAVFSSDQEKVFIYYDPAGFNRYLGAGGMIVVSNSIYKKYYWNLKEHQTQFNHEAAKGNAVNFKNYEPDYFTINGKSFPDLQKDESAAVKVNVGDTVLIYMVNTGQSLHSIHFHGFHCTALYSTSKAIGKNWIKDTFPIYSMEGVLLMLVPDKKGQYSVHDHNLVAVSGGGTHPNGMFLIMEIQ